MMKKALNYDNIISMVVDYFNKEKDLSNIKLFLLDMDGTIYNENQIFDGTLDFLSYVERIGGKYIFITNNSSKSVDDYVIKVNKMGIKANRDNFYTSTQATASYIKEKLGDVLVFASGTKSFVKELKECGIKVTTRLNKNIKAIVMGYDTELNYSKLRKLSELLLLDVPYIATNPDLVCPVSFGYTPDCGSVAIMLENATGRKPIYIGKPEPTMINFVMKKYGYSKEETCVIGDRVYTDIASGLNAGVCSICLLSGESTLKTIEDDPRKPTLVFKDIRELYNELNR